MLVSLAMSLTVRLVLDQIVLLVNQVNFLSESIFAYLVVQLVKYMTLLINHVIPFPLIQAVVDLALQVQAVSL